MFVYWLVGWFVLSLLLTVLIAKLVGAGRPSILWALVAQIGVAAVSAGLHLIMPNLPLLSFGLLFVLAVLIYSEALQANYLRAVVIYLGGSLVSALLLVAGVLWLTDLDWEALQRELRLGQTESNVDIILIEELAEEVCRCGENLDCLINETIEFAQLYREFENSLPSTDELIRSKRYYERAESCAENPTVYRPRRLVERLIQERGVEFDPWAERSTQEEVPDGIEQNIRRLRYGSVPLRDARNYIGYQVKVTRSSSQVIEATLDNIRAGELVLRTRQGGGTAEFTIPMNEIAELEVRK